MNNHKILHESIKRSLLETYESSGWKDGAPPKDGKYYLTLSHHDAEKYRNKTVFINVIAWRKNRPDATFSPRMIRRKGQIDNRPDATFSPRMINKEAYFYHPKSQAGGDNTIEENAIAFWIELPNGVNPEDVYA